MTDTRDISTPTAISLCVSGKYIMIKDLAGRSHIFSKDDKADIGSLVVELANDKNLPFVDVAKVSVSDDEQSTTSLADLDINDLDPENIKKVVLQHGLGWLKNMSSYPRGKSTASKKRTGK